MGKKTRISRTSTKAEIRIRGIRVFFPFLIRVYPRQSRSRAILQQRRQFLHASRPEEALITSSYLSLATSAATEIGEPSLRSQSDCARGMRESAHQFARRGFQCFSCGRRHMPCRLRHAAVVRPQEKRYQLKTGVVLERAALEDAACG